MTYHDNVTTQAGEATVMTKTRWMNIIPKPHTSLMPTKFEDLGRLGVAFHWSTSDPKILKQLHDILVETVRGSSLQEVRETIDMARGLPDGGTGAIGRAFGPPMSVYLKSIL